MTQAVLITQCLQRDFVDPISPHEPLPNMLHVGSKESLRLLGYDPTHGPVAQLMNIAHGIPADQLSIIHIRDWHDNADKSQTDHLRTFGDHCLAGEPGAAFVSPIEAGLAGRDRITVIDSRGLSDFEYTDLPQHIEKLLEESDGDLRIGVIGVWTEAKVSFLLYDLKTRYGIDSLATCSALTASASRSQHFNALDQMRKILGVKICDTVGGFAQWLVGHDFELPASSLPGKFRPELSLDDPELQLEPTNADLLGYLYRDSSRVELSPLSGGFSGAVVFKANSFDSLGHAQAPSVAKLGPRKLIGDERVAFERVENILGNNAPSVRDFVDFSDRAGLKYSYAAMGGGRVSTFKSIYESTAPFGVVENILRTVFEEVLEPFYSAAKYERLWLLDHYCFSERLAEPVKRNTEAILGAEADQDFFEFTGGHRVKNLVAFYRDFLPGNRFGEQEYHFVSYVHGDLNGANIIIDGRDNVWLIDFFHTAPAHVLKDLAKLENDLLYIFTEVSNDSHLQQALAITRCLSEIEDLGAPLPPQPGQLKDEQFVRAWKTIRLLREFATQFVGDDRSSHQLDLALLRYSAHTMTFDESSPLQKKWALAAACYQAQNVIKSAQQNKRLRLDWLTGDNINQPGKLGMTICPGRRDRGRVLADDLDEMLEQNVTRVYCLATEQELAWAGVDNLRQAVTQRGMRFKNLPIPDQGVPSFEEAHALVSEIVEAMKQGENVVAHCMGGLGRTGTIAACVAIELGDPSQQAINDVRQSRSPRAIENIDQENFIADFAK
jgi:protein-tyrosine phosphatase/nicotinamidase-related amidase